MSLEDKKEEKKVKQADIKEALMNLLNSSATGGNQFVTFSIGSEDYGIDIKKVQEITAFKDLTVLPNTPNYIKGILNLRGNVIPIMDPRVRFGLEEKTFDKKSVIIIFKSNNKTIGMIVDKISDVLTIDKENIEDTPEMAMNIDTSLLSGVGKVGDKFVIILSIDKILTNKEIDSLSSSKNPDLQDNKEA